MSTHTYIYLFLMLAVFSCKKEDRILNKLEGTWTVNEYNRKSTGTVTDFSNQKITFEFLPYKKAYTRTLKAIYRLDYVDAALTDVVDTFSYELKKDELSITKVQKTLNTQFLRQRFLLDKYKSNQLTLTRKDTTEYYIKATK